MENKKVNVKSMVNHVVGISVQELKLKRTWHKKGQVIPIDLETLREALYDPGVDYMFSHGMLYIEDLNDKIELGLEPEDAKAPENIIVLNEADFKKYLTIAPLKNLKEILEKISKETARAMAEYAVEKKIVLDLSRNKAILNACDVDVNGMININTQIEDDTAEEE